MCLTSRWCFFCLTFLLVGCSNQTGNRSLISAQTLNNIIIEKRDVQIVDLRTRDEFDAGHIPGAQCISRSMLADRNHEIEGMRIQKRDLEYLLSQTGFSDKDSIYIYDGKGNVDAARLWWILKVYGFEKVALIDGGFIQWRMSQYDVEGIERKRPIQDFRLNNKENIHLLSERSVVENKDFEQLIDARSLEEYSGELIKNGAFRPGHIPDAVLCDYHEFIEGGSFKIKSKTEIETIMKSKGLSKEKQTIAYCHSGVRSSFSTFVLTEIVGMQNVSNYDGSWIEWSFNENLPAINENSDLNL